MSVELAKFAALNWQIINSLGTQDLGFLVLILVTITEIICSSSFNQAWKSISLVCNIW